MFPGNSLDEKFELPRNRPTGHLHFLETLILNTNERDKDYIELQNAFNSVKSTVVEIASEVTAAQRFERVIDVQESLQRGEPCYG